MEQSNKINEIYNYACTLQVTPSGPTVPKDYVNYQYYQKLGKIDIRNKHWLKSIDDFNNDKRCCCYDSCFLLRKMLNDIGVENRIFYSCTRDVQKYQDGEYYYTLDKLRPTHAMIIYKEDNFWKWMQYSWYANMRNDWKAETIEQLLQKYIHMAQNSWHKPIYITEVTNFDVVGPRLDFFRRVMKKIEVENEQKESSEV